MVGSSCTKTDNRFSLRSILVVGGKHDGIFDENSAELLEIPEPSTYNKFLTRGPETVATQLPDFNVTIKGGIAVRMELRSSAIEQGTAQFGMKEIVLVCGGEQNGIISADCWIKDETRNDKGSTYWRKGPPMPEPRIDAGYWLDELQSKLIVMGGVTLGEKVLNSTVVFWAENETWAYDPELTLPFPDSDFSLTWDYTNFVKTGGSEGQNKAIIFKLNDKDNSVLMENLPNLIDPRYGHASFFTSEEELLMVAGGKGLFNTHIRTSQVYDKKTNEWSRGPDLPRDFAHGCVVRPHTLGSLYLIGGHPTDGRVIIYEDNTRGGFLFPKFHLTNIRLKKPREHCACTLVPLDVDVGAPKHEESSSGSMHMWTLSVHLVCTVLLYLLYGDSIYFDPEL